jgi:hypothetical protein
MSNCLGGGLILWPSLRFRRPCPSGGRRSLLLRAPGAMLSRPPCLHTRLPNRMGRESMLADRTIRMTPTHRKRVKSYNEPGHAHELTRSRADVLVFPPFAVAGPGWNAAVVSRSSGEGPTSSRLCRVGVCDHARTRTRARLAAPGRVRGAAHSDGLEGAGATEGVGLSPLPGC